MVWIWIPLLGVSYQGSAGTEFSSQIHLCFRNAAPRLSLHMEQNSPVPPSAGVCCHAVYKEIMKLPRALQTCGRSAPNPDPSAPLGGHSGGLSLTLNQPQGTWVLRAQAALAQLPAKAFKEQKGVRNTCTLFPSAPRLSSSLQPNTLPCSFPTCLLRIDLHYPILPGAVGIN